MRAFVQNGAFALAPSMRITLYNAEREPVQERITDDQLKQAAAIAIAPDAPLEKIRLLCNLVAALEVL